MPTRRTFVTGSLALGALPAWAQAAGAASSAGSPLVLGPAAPFDFARLADEARALAARPHVPAINPAPAVMQDIDFDAHWKIRYREEATFSPPGSDAQVQLFYPGRFFPEPVAIHLVEDGAAREIRFDNAYFSMPADSPARKLGEGVGFAGLRVMRPGLGPDWVSFLGASYFRTDGPFAQYGLSARGLAIDTGLSRPEEFPRFNAFWLAAPETPGDDLTIFALLESPSVVGAYRFGLKRGSGEGKGHRMSVASRLFFRRRVERLGIAPLTSMYWYSERDRFHAADWRPEIHDSDGLALATGTGERIWRPLNNPDVVRTSSFADTNPRGFGLVQRDRNFDHYQDDGVFYDRRPSAWIAPQGDWGPGAVQLVEIPTEDETFDNVVAYWMPADLPGPGEERAFDYTLDWTVRDPAPDNVATVVATYQGQGGIPGKDAGGPADKMVVDFVGPALDGLGKDDGVKPVVSISGGRIVSDVGAYPIARGEGWRLLFDFEVDGPGPAELRAFLRGPDGEALTETFAAQSFAGRAARRRAG
ncbi:MAG: glucan biosynthesis protein D [Acuticoccus sp.]